MDPGWVAIIVTVGLSAAGLVGFLLARAWGAGGMARDLKEAVGLAAELRKAMDGVAVALVALTSGRQEADRRISDLEGDRDDHEKRLREHGESLAKLSICPRVRGEGCP